MNETESFLKKYVFGFNASRVFIVIGSIFLILILSVVFHNSSNNKFDLDDIKLDVSSIKFYLTSKLPILSCEEVEDEIVPESLLKEAGIKTKYYDTITYSVKCEDNIKSEIKVKVKSKEKYGSYEYEG